MTAWRVNIRQRFLVYPLLWSGLLSLALFPIPATAQTETSNKPADEARTEVSTDTSSNKKQDLPFHAEMQLDFRIRVPTQNKVTSRLYSSYLSLQTEEDPATRGATLNLFGMDQHNAFRWQQASLSMELKGRGGTIPQRLQAGIIRLPFGIYDFRETYSSGLIDYPMPRVDYAYNAVDWGVPGAQWSGGTDRLQIEAAFFDGAGVGVWSNINRLDGTAVRLQTYAPPNLILGVSAWLGHQAAMPDQSDRGDVRLIGLDWRYTQPSLLVRGEAMVGVLAGDATRGAYLDIYYRIPDRERFTLVGRIEFLKPATNQPMARQITLGGRWNMDTDWTLSLNWRRNNIDRAYGFTWTTNSGPRGEFLVQFLRRFTIH